MLTNSCLLVTLQVLKRPYLWLNLAVIRFLALSQRVDAFLLLKKQEVLFEVYPPLLEPGAVDTTARNRLLKVDEVICFPFHFMTLNLTDVVSRSLIYSFCDYCTELDQL